MVVAIVLRLKATCVVQVEWTWTWHFKFNMSRDLSCVIRVMLFWAELEFNSDQQNMDASRSSSRLCWSPLRGGPGLLPVRPRGMAQPEVVDAHHPQFRAVGSGSFTRWRSCAIVRLLPRSWRRLASKFPMIHYVDDILDNPKDTTNPCFNTAFVCRAEI